MARKRKRDGGVYKRPDGKILWIWYRDRNGKRQQESSETDDWEEAHRRLRQRLEERDSNTLEALRKGEQLGFREWGEFFLENYSRPPIRADKTHEANMRALKHLNAAFGDKKLMEWAPDEIEIYLRSRLRQRTKIQTLKGSVEKGQLEPSTVHQEFRVLRRVPTWPSKRSGFAVIRAMELNFPLR